MSKLRTNILITVLSGAAFLAALYSVNWSWADLWLTPDQQGDRLMRRGEFVEAASHYRDPARMGMALFRAGEFKQAVTVFGRQRTPEGRYNLGTAQVMLGQYEAAEKMFGEALEESW